MKRIIALMSAAIIAAGMFTSCRKTYPYDTDKAISLATEYMKNKYGKDIKDIETYKKTHGSDAYIGVKFKLDETDAETPDTNTYEVRVYVDGEGEEKHYVKCDDYMNEIFKPFWEEKLDYILSSININNYDSVITDVHQSAIGGNDFFSEGFVKPNQDSLLEYYIKNYRFHFDYLLRLPYCECNTNGGADKTFKLLCEKLKELFDDDSIRLITKYYLDEQFTKGIKSGFKSEYIQEEKKEYINYEE